MAVRIINLNEPIPGYKLIERLGGGGFGEVWKAEAPGGLMKAIKFVFGDLREGGKKGAAAEQELAALNQIKAIRHPFIISIERADIVDGKLIIVTELADRDLMGRFRECQQAGLPGIPRREMLRYLEEAAEALDFMNGDHGLMHLDIKPQNLFLIQNHIKVADFGLVKSLAGRKGPGATGVTPLYSSPETIQGRVSQHSDQYSLAILYQELLTGKCPFRGTSVVDLLIQHVKQPPDLSLLPAADRVVIARALAKEPEERFPCCMQLVRALQNAGSQHGPGEPRPASALALAGPAPPLEFPEEISLQPLDGEEDALSEDPADSAEIVVNADCPKCGKKGFLPERWLGRRIRCRKCAQEFTVTQRRPPKPAPPAR